MLYWLDFTKNLCYGEFGLTIRGHFARVYVVNNTLFDNFCHEGLLAMRGMEKEMWIFGNNSESIALNFYLMLKLTFVLSQSKTTTALS